MAGVSAQAARSGKEVGDGLAHVYQSCATHREGDRCSTWTRVQHRGCLIACVVAAVFWAVGVVVCPRTARCDGEAEVPAPLDAKARDARVAMLKKTAGAWWKRRAKLLLRCKSCHGVGCGACEHGRQVDPEAWRVLFYDSRTLVFRLRAGPRREFPHGNRGLVSGVPLFVMDRPAVSDATLVDDEHGLVSIQDGKTTVFHRWIWSVDRDPRGEWCFFCPDTDGPWPDPREEDLHLVNEGMYVLWLDAPTVDQRLGYSEGECTPAYGPGTVLAPAALQALRDRIHTWEEEMLASNSHTAEQIAALQPFKVVSASVAEQVLLLRLIPREGVDHIVARGRVQWVAELLAHLFLREATDRLGILCEWYVNFRNADGKVEVRHESTTFLDAPSYRRTRWENLEANERSYKFLRSSVPQPGWQPWK